MNDSTRRTIVGMFPAGAEIVSFQPVEATMIADAEARLDAEKAKRDEAERLARSRITVDRAWFLATMSRLTRYIERDRAEASWWGDRAAGAALSRRARELRADVDQVMRYNEAEGPKR